jgi:hypothetical protein
MLKSFRVDWDFVDDKYEVSQTRWIRMNNCQEVFEDNQ